MLPFVAGAVITWNDPALPLKTAGEAFVQVFNGAATFGELNSVNALLVSYMFVLLKEIVVPSGDTAVIVGAGT